MSQKSTTIEDFLIDDESKALYAEETLVIDALETVCEWMEAANCSRAELARRLGISAAAVTLMFKAETLGLRRLARIAHVLGGVAKVEICRVEAQEQSNICEDEQSRERTACSEPKYFVDCQDLPNDLFISKHTVLNCNQQVTLAQAAHTYFGPRKTLHSASTTTRLDEANSGGLTMGRRVEDAA